MLVLILGVPFVLSKIGMDIYKTAKEEHRKDKELETQCEIELKTAEKIKELPNI